MDRRRFLKQGAGALLGTAVLSRCKSEVPHWRDTRLVRAPKATQIERTAVADAAELLGEAIGSSVPVAVEGGAWRPADILVANSATTRTLLPGERPRSSTPGAFRISLREEGPWIIAGADPEGARNGLYAFLERLGLGLFRDGERLVRLEGPMPLDPRLEMESRPAFRWRGQMIWDHYLGPRRYCAALWDESDWDRALRYMARKGMNFCEFYPPLERIFELAFPEAEGLGDGSVWSSRAKHEMVLRTLARGRSRGLHFAYVLSYGAFPEPVQRLFPDLEWRNGYLCAGQGELQELTRRVWKVLLRELGTDHWYALRHRGEEGQSYSDPCRRVSKAEGYRQAISLLRELDPDARITVWTWAETLPDLFLELPADVRAVHIRHGMAGLFAARGEGREQADGRPDLPPGRRWLSAQFTVFGGNETLLQTAWCDAWTLARDAVASAETTTCEGFLHWPEWSNTSPWLSEVIARLGWDPTSVKDPMLLLEDLACRRHGARAAAFLAGFRPLIEAGNARFMSPPRKRLLVPYFMGPELLEQLGAVRAGALEMKAALSQGPPSALFERDFVDLLTWVGWRQAHALEAAGYLHHLAAEHDAAEAALSAAEQTWKSLRELLALVPELSIVASARSARGAGPLSKKVVESFWELACDFYHGYPLVLTLEAIELVYLDQSRKLRRLIREAARRGELARLEAPGWFWHDFPDRAWAEAVRKLPEEDAGGFEATMRQRLREALQSEKPPAPPPGPPKPEALRKAADEILSVSLPSPLSGPPRVPAPG